MRHLVTATLAVCAACGPVEGAEEAAPRIPLSSPTSSLRQEVRRDDDGIIIMNGLDPATLGENFLLNDDTHRAALIANKLESATFSSGGPLFFAVQHDPRAVEVLKYVVRCALAPTDPPVVALGQTMTGEAGLCRAWATGSIAADDTCQRRVSACLFALSNAVGAHVPVSIRGKDLALSAAPEVRPWSMTTAGTRHSVLNGCGVATAGVRHNCGWQPVDDAAADAAGIAKIFACTPGATVRVGAGSACTGVTLGTMTPGSDKVLRVCAGIGPCRGPTTAEPTPPGYLGQAQNDSCGTIKPEVVFTCPAEAKYVVLQRDYYVPVPPRTPGTMTVGQLGSLGAASEASVFPAREGTFFGSLFAGPLGTRVTWSGNMLVTTRSGSVVFPGAFSCEDALYTDELAYRSARLCALNGDQCLTTWTGTCQGEGTRPRVCDSVTLPAASGAFYGCWSPAPGASKFDEGLTTFLRTPCDLIGGSAACKQSPVN